MNNRLSIGICINPGPVEMWADAIMRYVRCAQHLEWVSTIEVPMPPRSPAASWHYRLDRLLHETPLGPLSLIENKPLPDQHPLEVETGVTRTGLDLIIDLIGVDPTVFAGGAGHGRVWFYELRSSPEATSTMDVFRLIHGGYACVTLDLCEMHNTSRLPTLLYRSTLRADLHSVWRTRERVLQRLSEVVIRCLEGIRYGQQHHMGFTGPATQAGDRSPRISAPNIHQHVLCVGAKILKGNAVRLSTRSRWHIGVRERLINTLVAPSAPAFTEIKAPSGRFFADPFPFETVGQRVVFFEDFSYSRGKGVISVATLDVNLHPREVQVILECDYHLSYPFVFGWGGAIWMVPETFHAGCIYLYRATVFPWCWKRERVLLEGVNAVDPTILFHGGKFWLFANMAASKHAIQDELHVFYADDPLADLIPHRCNPVVSNVSCSRPGGSIFYSDDGLLRPSQDCSVSYGRSLVLNRIDELSEDRFVEVSIARIDPSWKRGATGTHTLSRSEHLEAIDWRTREIRFQP